MLDPATLSSLKVTELKAELKRRGLPVGGLKQALVERLADDILQERQKEQEAAEAVAPEEEQQPAEENSEQVNGSAAETAVETIDVAPEVVPEQPVQERLREKTPEPEPVQVQEPVEEPEPVQEQAQELVEEPEPVHQQVHEPLEEPEPVQEQALPVEIVQEKPQEPEPTPVPEQVQEELAVELPQQGQEHEAPAVDVVEEQLQATSEQLASEQQESPGEKTGEKQEPVNQVDEPEVLVEADDMQVDIAPEKTPEDAPTSIPDEPVAKKEEDAPMLEAPVEAPVEPLTEVPTEVPVEVPTEAPTEAPVEAPIEPTITPAPSSFLTSTEDEITTALTSQVDLAAPTASSEPMDTREDTPSDLRKRKRRSASPPPAEEPLPASTEVPDSEEGSVSKKPRASSPTAPKPRQRDARFKGLFNNGDTSTQDHETTADTSADGATAAADDDDDPPVPPSIHPATRALYIRNLIRPINEPLLRSHLSTLAGATVGEAIEFFFVDSIKSHALMIFASVTAATRVRVGVHGKVWPNERTRKPLWVDFVPEESVEGWVQREKKSRGRWEVVYKEGEGEDGGVRAELEEVGAGGAQARGRGAAGGRGVELLGAPTGPRGARERVVERKNSVLAVQKAAPTQPPTDSAAATGAGPRPTRVVDLDDLFKSTLAKPKLYYMPVSEEIARERLAARARDERSRH